MKNEPLPVFDCLFCCQEHFVLNKINEMTLINKYSKNVMDDWNLKLSLMDLAIKGEGVQKLSD